MSASSKKKLRNELNAAKMTERQIAEQKEAKKLKVYTTCFVIVLSAIVVVAAIFAGHQFWNNSGFRERTTVALVIGEEKVSNADLNYYYIDAINEFYNYYGAYASFFGLDLTVPLNEQVINEETGETWADDFLNSAKANAQATYALVAEAKANGHTLSAEEQASVNNQLATVQVYASIYGYPNADDFLKAQYGMGASLKGYQKYLEMNALANSYYSAYYNGLTYDKDAIAAGDDENPAEFSAFSYNYYYLNVNSFLTGGTTDEEGKVTYSDEEKANAVTAAEEAAKSIVSGEITSVEDLDAAIAALEVNANSETKPKSTACENYAYANVTQAAKEWITDSARVAGDITYIANTTTTTAEDGTETTIVNGYYVVYFRGASDNAFPLVNVRHILIGFEGGTYDSTTGATVYSEDEKMVAKVKAEELLAQWQSGKADEASFILLAQEHSTDPGSKENGGLYENIYPGQMVPTFDAWCFEEGRQPGDYAIVETDFGYHIMFFSGYSETTYRDLLIENTLRNKDTQAWYDALIEATVVTEKNTQYLSKDFVFTAG